MARFLGPKVNGIDYKKLDERRKVLGLSVNLLSNRAGIVNTRMATMLKGESPWRVKDVQKVLEVLKVDAEDVIADEVVLSNYYEEIK